MTGSTNARVDLIDAHRAGADAPVEGVAFHPGGRSLATVDAEGAVHIFDVTAK